MNEDAKRFARLDEASHKAALERYRVLRPVIEAEAPQTQAAREANVGLRTVQRWMAAYKRDGLAGLAGSPRRYKGHCHGLPDQLERAIEGLALVRPKPSMAAVHRKALEIAEVYG